MCHLQIKYLQINYPLVSGLTFKHSVFAFTFLKDYAYLTAELFNPAAVFFMSVVDMLISLAALDFSDVIS